MSHQASTRRSDVALQAEGARLDALGRFAVAGQSAL